MQLKTMFEHRIKEARLQDQRKRRTVEMLEECLRGVPGAERFTLERAILEWNGRHYVTIATHPEPDTDPGGMMDEVLRTLRRIEGWTMPKWERKFEASAYTNDDDVDTNIGVTLYATREKAPVTRVEVTFTKLGKPPACEVTITPIEERTESVRYSKTVICTDPLTGEETRVEVA